MASEVPSEEQGDLTLGSPDQDASAGKRSSPNTWLCKPVEIASEKDRGLLENEVNLLRGVCTDPLVHKLTYSEFQCRGNSSKSVKGIWRGTTLTNIRVKAGKAGVKASLSGDGSPVRHQCFFVEPSSHSAHRHHGHQI